MLRGELWWARAPTSVPRRKRRLMLIVSDDAFNQNENYPKVMGVHLTSVKRLGGPYDWEVAVPRGTGGLDRHSIAKCGEVYTIRKEQLQGPVATVPAEIMQQVDRALAVALSLRLA